MVMDDKGRPAPWIDEQLTDADYERFGHEAGAMYYDMDSDVAQIQREAIDDDR